MTLARNLAAWALASGFLVFPATGRLCADGSVIEQLDRLEMAVSYFSGVSDPSGIQNASRTLAGMIDGINADSGGRTVRFFAEVRATLELWIQSSFPPSLTTVPFQQMLQVLRVRIQEARVFLLQPDHSAIMDALSDLESTVNYHEGANPDRIPPALEAIAAAIDHVSEVSGGLTEVFFAEAQAKIRAELYTLPGPSYLAYSEILWLVREGIRVAREQLFRPVWQPTAFLRGDSNSDGAVDSSDAVHVLLYLFNGGAQPKCGDAADADDNGRLALGDAVGALSHLFLGTQAPSTSYGRCGPDRTPLDRVGCEDPGRCP